VWLLSVVCMFVLCLFRLRIRLVFVLICFECCEVGFGYLADGCLIVLSLLWFGSVVYLMFVCLLVCVYLCFKLCLFSICFC